MFVHTTEKSVPIKIWQSSYDALDEKCKEQAQHLSKLPFAHKWIALMPDTHAGKGMPIGGVIACDGVVIPNAVGVDIGCGMGFVQTDIPVSLLRETMTGSGNLVQTICGDILRNIPTGFNHYKKPQVSEILDRAKAQAELNAKWHSAVDPSWNLHFLPVDTDEGSRYIRWMQLSMDFAYENRSIMLTKVKEIFTKHIMKQTGIEPHFSNEINCHHNYAALENHFGKDVWVHRKGAIRAAEGELAIIPGAMGSFSYIVRGKGNPESFMSSSHGAGRVYSRTAAVATFPVDKVMCDLKEQNVVLAKHNKSDVAEESRFAYKDIEDVMANQTDLVEPVKKLFTVGVVKG